MPETPENGNREPEPRASTSRIYLSPTHRIRVWINSDGTVGHSAKVKEEPLGHIGAGQAMVQYAEKLHKRLTTARLWLATARAGNWETPQ